MCTMPKSIFNSACKPSQIFTVKDCMTFNSVFRESALNCVPYRFPWASGIKGQMFNMGTSLFRIYLNLMQNSTPSQDSLFTMFSCVY